jgi:hypothetical protein
MSQFDLASLDSAAKAEDGAELEVLHPISGEKLGIAIRLAGTDSAVHRKATTAIAAARKADSAETSILMTSRPRVSRFWPAVRSAGLVSCWTARTSLPAKRPLPHSIRAFLGSVSRWKPLSPIGQTTCRTDHRAVRSRRRLCRRNDADK